MTNAMSDKSTEGRAGEIEITPEMIEAGVNAFECFYIDDLAGSGLRSAIASVYCSMQTERLKHRHVPVRPL